MNLPSKITQAVSKVYKPSPTVMVAAGVVSMAVSTVLACRSTLKLHDVLDEYEVAKKKQATLVEANIPTYTKSDEIEDSIKLKVVLAGDMAKLYAPAVIFAAIGVACIAGAHVQMLNQNTALTAAYAGLQQTYKSYRERIAQELGVDKEKELHYESQNKALSEKNKDGTVSKRNKKTPTDHSVYARFFDESCPDWQREPEYNMVFLHCQQQYANNKLRAQGHLFLNEVYDCLGIPRTGAGQIVGWTMDGTGDNYVDFGIFAGDTAETRAFVNGLEKSILLDFNVDGDIHKKI